MSVALRLIAVWLIVFLGSVLLVWLTDRINGDRQNTINWLLLAGISVAAVLGYRLRERSIHR